MTKNVDHRNRVRTGKTAGQFAPEAHQEPIGVTLTAPSPLDQVAAGVVGDLVRARSSIEIGTWQRRMDKGARRDLPWPPMPEVLVELDRRAKDFETLPREEQEGVLDQLKMPGTKHLLEPGQRLGNDKIRVADGVEEEAGNIGLALAAQKIIADADLPGTVTMTKAGDHYTVFTVEDGGVAHNLQVGPRSFTISAESADGDSGLDDWLHRATITSSGSNVFEPRLAEGIRRSFESHRESAATMAAVSVSSFRGAGNALGELNRRSRTAELRADGVDYVLDVYRDEPALRTEDGEALHPSMVSGFLNHMATETGHPDGDALASDLREVFREADRRLIR